MQWRFAEEGKHLRARLSQCRLEREEAVTACRALREELAAAHEKHVLQASTAGKALLVFLAN